MASSNSPCAACKFLRRKCTQECVFAPYFPPDQPQKFANVHKVFGASNVAKLLNELNPTQREDAVNSLAYEAEHRLRDPVYGCVGLISILQHKLKQVQLELYNARKELSTYIGPQAMQPLLLHQAHHPQVIHPTGAMGPFGMSSMALGLPPGPSAQSQLMIRDPQQQQLYEVQQYAALAAAREQQELMRGYEQQQQDLIRYNATAYDANAGGQGTGGGGGGVGGFNQMSAAMPSPLAMVPVGYENAFQLQQHQQQQQAQQDHQHQQQQQQVHSQPQPQQRTGSDEGTSVGPSS
ncbi:hypothetical protein AQUCO_00700083v1 [Aquilegia coerulea]|uniref:LOB domain-containing protein n=1 Tax=Aquilegia coerulea TaxID=218851 RepID=A0A2G5EIE1_AQUCA|nr:hypothetical protein AQUCO_00700083v1 [Aquilegia coerulea]PIA55536.1 hypothetical protein AQUCO_00700083v1 [Aquilegia coerulea]